MKRSGRIRLAIQFAVCVACAGSPQIATSVTITESALFYVGTLALVVAKLGVFLKAYKASFNIVVRGSADRRATSLTGDL